MIDISFDIGIIESLSFHFQLMEVMRIYSMEAVGKHLRQKLAVEEEESLTMGGIQTRGREKSSFRMKEC